MNKFISNLTRSNTDIRFNRATRIAAEAKADQEDLTRELAKEVRDLENKLEDLYDLNHSTTTSLNVVKGSFDGSTWVRSIQETKIALANKTLELAIAEETTADFFEEKEDVVESNDPEGGKDLA